MIICQRQSQLKSPSLVVRAFKQAQQFNLKGNERVKGLEKKTKIVKNDQSPHFLTAFS